MLNLSWKNWVAIIVGGVIAGLALSALLPHESARSERMHAYAMHGVTATHAAPTPSLVTVLPWILVLGGFFLGILLRKNRDFLVFAGTAITAGVTLLSQTGHLATP